MKLETPRIEDPWPREYREYVALFNAGDYFEAHEVLEDLWAIEVAPLKDFYKGLIQMAVAICHWERGNPSGARRLWVSSRDYLTPYGARYEGLEIGAVLGQLGNVFAPLLSGGVECPPAPELRSIPKLEIISEHG